MTYDVAPLRNCVERLDSGLAVTRPELLSFFPHALYAFLDGFCDAFGDRRDFVRVMENEGEHTLFLPGEAGSIHSEPDVGGAYVSMFSREVVTRPLLARFSGGRFGHRVVDQFGLVYRFADEDPRIRFPCYGKMLTHSYFHFAHGCAHNSRWTKPQHVHATPAVSALRGLVRVLEFLAKF